MQQSLQECRSGSAPHFHSLPRTDRYPGVMKAPSAAGQARRDAALERLFSVVTPTLNAAAHLQETIDSVASQWAGGVRVEHLFVDDGSTDGTLAIAERNGITVVPGRRAGLYDAMNVGTEASSGEIVSILGAGDVLLPGALSAVARRVGRPGVEWVVGGINWIDAEGGFLGYVGPPPKWMNVEMFASLGWSCIHHQSTFLTRDLLDRLGGYDPDFRIAGDYELLARAMQTASFERIARPIAGYLRDGSNLSLNPATAAENEEVAVRFGPSSAIRRKIYREALRLWLNGRHPRWFWHKRFN